MLLNKYDKLADQFRVRRLVCNERYHKKVGYIQMRTHKIETWMHLPLEIEDVFLFFREAENLQRITPPELNFRILTPLPIPIDLGTTVDYQLSLFRIPFRWRSEITVWDPPRCFVDKQVLGPYKLWEHTHLFSSNDNGTMIEDRVIYQLPYWPLGEIAYPLVHLQLKRIFSYRQQTISNILLMEIGKGQAV